MAYFRKFFHFGLKAKYKYMLMFFGLAFLLAFCFFQMTCLASTEIPLTVIDNMRIDPNSSTISEFNSYSIGYAHLQKGHKYVINNNRSGNIYVGLTDSVPVDRFYCL